MNRIATGIAVHAIGLPSWIFLWSYVEHRWQMHIEALGYTYRWQWPWWTGPIEVIGFGTSVLGFLGLALLGIYLYVPKGQL